MNSGYCRNPFFLGLIVVALSIAGCASLTNEWVAPEVALRSLQPRQIGVDEQRLLVGLDITNPNDRTLPIKAMTYSLKLDGDEIASGGGKLERQIAAGATEPVEVEVTANTLLLATKLPAMVLSSEPVPYRISGTFTLAGLIPVPYRYSGEIDPRSLLYGGRRFLGSN